MMKSKYRAEQLVKLYTLAKKGVSGSELFDATGIPATAYKGKLLAIESYLKGKPFSLQTSQAMKDAVVALRQEEQHPGNGVVKASATPENTNLIKLEEAFRVFQEAIVDVIVSESDRRSSELLAKKEADLANQKEKYETEIQRLQAIIIQMKDSSVVGMIKKRWLQ